MPLREEDIPALLGHFESKGLGDLHDRANYDNLRRIYFTDVVAGNPDAAMTNAEILRKARDTSIQRRVSIVKQQVGEMPELLRPFTKLDEFTGEATMPDVEGFHGTSMALSRVDTAKRFREEHPLRAPATEMFGGFTTGLASMVPGRTESYDEMERQLDALAQTGMASKVFQGVGHLGAFMIPASGVGKALKATTAVGKMVIPFAAAGALTTPGGGSDRALGAGMGIVAGALGAGVNTVLEPVAGRLAGRWISRFGTGPVSRTMAERILPEVMSGIGESVAFTGLASAHQFFASGEMDLWESFMINLGTIGLLKGARGARGAFRSGAEQFARTDKSAQEFANTPPEHRAFVAESALKTGAFRPFEIHLARMLADKGIVLPKAAAETILSDPVKVEQILTKENPALMEAGLFKATYSPSAAQVGPFQRLPPNERSGFTENAMTLDALNGVRVPSVQLIPELQALSGLGLPFADVPVITGIREQLLATSLKWHQAAEKATDPAVKARLTHKAFEIEQEANGAISLNAYRRKIAAEMRVEAVRLEQGAKAELAKEPPLKGPEGSAAWVEGERTGGSAAVELLRRTADQVEYHADITGLFPEIATKIHAQEAIIRQVEKNRAKAIQRWQRMAENPNAAGAILRIVDRQDKAIAAANQEIQLARRTLEQMEELAGGNDPRYFMQAPHVPMAYYVGPEVPPIEIVGRIQQLDAIREPVGGKSTQEVLRDAGGVNAFASEASRQVYNVLRERINTNAQDRPESVRAQSAKKLDDWNTATKAWIAGGRKGAMPENPFKDTSYSGKALDALGEAIRMAETPEQRADNLAAGAIQPGSKLAELLKSKDARKVEGALRIAYETASLPLPWVEVNVKEVRNNKAERGFLTLPGGSDKKVTGPPERAPDPRSAVAESERALADLLDQVGRANADPGLVAGTDGGGVHWYAVNNHMDRLRQFIPVLKKAVSAPWTENMVRFVYDQRAKWLSRSNAAEEWHHARVAAPWDKFTKGLSDEGHAAFRERFVAALEGKATPLNPGEADLVNSIRVMYEGYKVAKQMRGEPVLEGDYFTHIFESLQSDYVGDKFAVEHIKRIKSRFDKPRESTRDDFSRDVPMVLRAYMRSQELKIAFDPVAKLWAHQKREFGVIGARRGDPFYKDDAKIPSSTAKYLDREIDIWSGRTGDWSKNVENWTGILFSNTLGRIPQLFGRDQYMIGGREILQGWRSVNFLGAAAMNVRMGLGNLAGNVNTVSLIGPKYWAKGLKEFTLRRNTGDYEFNKLLVEMGAMEGTYTKTVLEDVKNALSRHGITEKLGPAVENVQKVLLFFFSKAELINRGAAGIGAYHKYRDTNASQYSDMRKLHHDALTYSREVITTTQFNYDKILGGQAYSGSLGKLLGQFTQYSVNYLDFLRLVTARALGSKHALRQLPGLLPGEKAAWSAIRAWTAPFLAAGGLALFNVHLDELEGPLSGTPEAIKYGGQIGVELVGGLVGSLTGSTGALEDNTIHGNVHGRVVGRAVNRRLGTESRSHSWSEALLNTFGPAANEFSSVATLMDDMIGGRYDRIKPTVDNGLGLFIEGGSIQAKRFFRFLEEEKLGYVAAKQSGQRLYPDSDVPYDKEDRFLRMLGIETATVDETMDALSDVLYVKERRDARVAAVNLSTMRLILDEGDHDKALAKYLVGLDSLQEEFGETLTVKEAAKGWKSILGEAKNRAELSKKDRVLAKPPFSRQG